MVGGAAPALAVLPAARPDRSPRRIPDGGPRRRAADAPAQRPVDGGAGGAGHRPLSPPARAAVGGRAGRDLLRDRSRPRLHGRLARQPLHADGGGVRGAVPDRARSLAARRLAAGRRARAAGAGAGPAVVRGERRDRRLPVRPRRLPRSRRPPAPGARARTGGRRDRGLVPRSRRRRLRFRRHRLLHEPLRSPDRVSGAGRMARADLRSQLAGRFARRSLGGLLRTPGSLLGDGRRRRPVHAARDRGAGAPGARRSRRRVLGVGRRRSR